MTRANRAAHSYWVHSAPGDSEGQRDCACGDWCSASTRDNEGTWHPALTFQPFCPADRGKIITSLEELPQAYRRLAERIGDPVRSGSAVRVAAGSRVLISPQVDALMRTATAVLGGWAARVRAVPGLSLSGHDYPHGSSDAVTADCGTLARHPDPLLALPAAPAMRTWTWNPGSPMPPDLDGEIGGLDAVRGGDGWVTAFTTLSGEDAGLEILALHRRAVRLLGENPAAAQTLDGIPCRDCEDMGTLALLEQPPPDPENPEPAYVRCLACRAEMTRTELGAWSDMYAAWTRGAGVLICRRCEMSRHDGCCWDSCGCAAAGHAEAA